MRLPRAGGGGDLDQNTTLYIDLYVCLELLHLRYPEYIAQTNCEERSLYQLYISLKGLKESEVMERAQREAEIERDIQRATQDGYRH